MAMVTACKYYLPFHTMGQSVKIFEQEWRNEQEVQMETRKACRSSSTETAEWNHICSQNIPIYD